jgi:hypothetical protein
MSDISFTQIMSRSYNETMSLPMVETLGEQQVKWDNEREQGFIERCGRKGYMILLTA